MSSDLFNFKGKSTAFAVMGNPVAHSKSPQIHAQFAAQFDINLSYSRIQVDSGGFNQAVSHFFAQGGGGLNVTLPYKVEAWRLCQSGTNTRSARADAAQAVNTLAMTDNGSIAGDNTDGVGLVNDLKNNIKLSLGAKRILLVGAGGAVRGVVAPLLAEQPAALHIANRTLAKAQDLTDYFKSADNAPQAKALDFIPSQPYDLVINGSSAGIENNLPGISERCIGAQTVCYDFMYSNNADANAATVFMQWALSVGADSAHDGLGMLVEQAAESFHIWHGSHPDTQAVIAAMRKY